MPWKTADKAGAAIRRRPSSPCSAPCSLTAAASATSSASSARRIFTCRRTARSTRRCTRCSAIRRSSTRSPCSIKCAPGAFITKKAPQNISCSSWRSRRRPRTSSAMRRSSMTRRCCAICPRRLRHRRDGLRGRRLGAGDPGSSGKAHLCPAARQHERVARAHRHGAAEGLRPPEGAVRVRQRHFGPVHRPARSRQVHQRPEPLRPRAAGGPTPAWARRPWR